MKKLTPFLTRVLSSIDGDKQPFSTRLKNRVPLWKQLFSVFVLLAFIYTLLEWAFFVTMPSFMDIMGWPTKIEILLISSLWVSIFSLALFVIFIALDLIGIAAHFSKITRFLGGLLPAFFLASMGLLLLDNFTYTVFKFGISTSAGFVRGVYAFLFVILTVYAYLRISISLGLIGRKSPGTRSTSRLFFTSTGLLAAVLVLALVRLDYRELLPTNAAAKSTHSTSLPNIILLGSDGLNATNLSAYGYRRDTTPQLAELAQTSLVAENAFTNAGNTAGSVISIMTSKLPTQTRVLYPPNILTGVDSYEHLPGILKGLGYHTVEFGAPYYIDAYNYNLQNGFDIANNRTLNVGKLGDVGRKLGYEDEVYFLSRITWRLSDRILHIFFIRTMQNPFDIVTQTIPETSDPVKIDQVLDYLDHAETPVFIHAHLLGTHGGYYSPPDQLFSIGKSQVGPWLTDFYDDTLRAFDSYVGEVIAYLKEHGLYENTILIIYTDHNQQFKTNERIPLIIHFPGGEHAGRLAGNAENLDISPTILDYLGVDKPDWMGGVSLLEPDLPEDRLIFSMGTTKTKPNEDKINFLDPALDKPPFYQFSTIDAIDCQKWYSLDLTTFEWTSGDVTGYIDPCDPDELRSPDQVRQAMYDRLAEDGFDISSLP